MEGGYYKVVVGDHIDYRYEVLQELDKGAFGQVVRCLDHKLRKEVAVKINRNSKFDHTSSRTEISILKRINAGVSCPDPQEEAEFAEFQKRLVKFVDSFFFRNHYVKTPWFF